MAVSVIFGGQWGSEGKGKTTYYFTKKYNASAVVRVGGPNSGHIIVNDDGNKTAFQILPVASVMDGVTCVLPAGTYIDLDILFREIQESGVQRKNLKIHPNAIIINQSARDIESADGLNDRIGSTQSGTGEGVVSRIRRDFNVVQAKDIAQLKPYLCYTEDFLREELIKNHDVIIEGTQGFGLSLLHSREYPYVTSRDTSVAAFISEAGLSPFDVRNVIMTLRAFPIRVAGNSGPLPKETNWDTITSEAHANSEILEYTTVTKRVRRVAEFDADVVLRSINSNRPNIVVLNHCDYFDYSINNQAFLSRHAEECVASIEKQIGSVNYIGTGDRTIFKRK